MSNQRRNIISNPRFQYKFSAVICSLVLLGSIIYPITIYDVFDYFISMDPSSASVQSDKRMDLLLILGAVEVLLLGFVFLFSVLISHRIAGPMYKLTSYLQSIRNGEEIRPLSFRTGDEFQEIPEEVNKTIEYILNRSEEEIEYLDEISAYIENISLVVPEDKKPVLDEIQLKVKKIKDLRK